MTEEDTELQLMFWLYRHRGWEPSKFYNMTEGEKAVAWAFVLEEIERG